MKYGGSSLESFDAFKDQLGKDIIEVSIDGIYHELFSIEWIYYIIAFFSPLLNLSLQSTIIVIN